MQIGFEIWTMQNDILFDNIYIGHSIEDAEKLKAETFDVKVPIEKEEEEASKPPPEEPIKSPLDLKFMDDPAHYIREKFDLFITIAKNDPIAACRFVPEVAGFIGVTAVTVIVLILAVLGSSSSAAPKVQEAKEKAKASATDAKDKVASAATTGAETAKEEVSKRTTRSSAAAE